MRRFVLFLVLASTVATLAVYLGYIDTGLFYDDFHFIRPLTSTELHRVWYGSWDPTGIESVFFRPLTAVLFAGRFWVFALNSLALHSVSILVHIACAIALGLIVKREGLGSRAALLSSTLYALYPTFPYAQVSWLTNQMHLVESLCVLVAIAYWQGVRTGPINRSLPLVVIALIAFLIKEDAVMLLPVIAVLTALYRRYAGTLSRARVGWSFLLASATAVTLFGWRVLRLGALGGYGQPDLASAQANWWRGLTTTLLLWPTRRSWQAVAATIAIALILTASSWALRRRQVALVLYWFLAMGVVGIAIPYYYLPQPVPYPTLTVQGIASGVTTGLVIVGLGVAVARRDRGCVYLALMGLIILLGFNVPFMLVSKREQYHLISAGAVLILAAALEGLLKAVDLVPRRLLVGNTVLAVLALPLGVLGRHSAADFAPCSEQVLTIDAGVASWWVVPSALSDWSHNVAAACREGSPLPNLSSIPVVIWGELDSPRLPNVQANAQEKSRWIAEESVVLVSPEIESVSIGFRRPVDLNIGPTKVSLRTFAEETSVILQPGDWKYVTVRFQRDWLVWFRQAHRVDLAVDSWFVPAVMDPKSSDLRRFGAEFQVGDLRPRSGTVGR